MPKKTESAYKRVILKVSGEALAGEKEFGLCQGSVKAIASEIRDAYDTGAEVGIVVGGGNICRGAREEESLGIDRVTFDYIGMLGTVINSLALKDALEALGITTKLQSAIEMPKICEFYVKDSASRYLKEGKIVIFCAGTGNPYFTTDTTAALRSIEMKADVLLKATQVDGVYTADPKKNKNAKRYDSLTFKEAIEKRLAVMDITAFSLCMENNLPIVVFDLHKKGNIAKVVKGQNIGTVVKN